MNLCLLLVLALLGKKNNTMKTKHYISILAFLTFLFSCQKPIQEPSIGDIIEQKGVLSVWSNCPEINNGNPINFYYYNNSGIDGSLKITTNFINTEPDCFQGKTVELPLGIYSYSANDTLGYGWTGNFEIKEVGKCQTVALQQSNAETGSLMFWTSSNISNIIGVEYIEVYLENEDKGQLTYHFPYTVPECGTAGTITLSDLAPGYYNCTAQTANNVSWSGSVLITSNTCERVHLVYNNGTLTRE